MLWRASFRRHDGQATIEVDGMDLVVLRGERIARDDIYFDRTALAPLLGG